MAFILTVGAVIISALLFGWAVPLARLFDAFQPMIVALSIMVAAVFVRLNRGMPSLEWKSVDANLRSSLTSKLYELSKEYGLIIFIIFVTIATLVTLSTIGIGEINKWPPRIQRITSGSVGFLFSLSLLRIAYVIWRDIDIVKLQKKLIDTSASAEAAQLQSQEADEKVADIKAAGLRKIEIPPPKAWGD